jgi:hypothetical protein
MTQIYIDVDVAQTELPVNAMPLVDATDGATIEEAIAYNDAGMDLNWNFITSAGSFTQTNVVPTTSGTHDWTHQGNGMYTLEVPASGGTINNDTEGYGWFTGNTTATLPFRSPTYCFRAAALNDALVDGGDTLDVNTTAISGTAQTGRDLGASVLLSSGTGTGQISLSSGLVTAGTVSDKTGYRLSATGVDDIWDEASSGHVAAGSFGAAMYTIRSNTAQAGASTTITLDASASASDDFYNNQRIYIVGGTGAGQSNTITDYNGTTKVATVQDSWVTNPSSDSVFVIRPFGGIPGASAPTASAVADAVWDEAYGDHTSEGSYGSIFQPTHEGTAQAGTSTTITLDATGSSSTDDFYNYGFVRIIAGTGAGQTRQVSDYNGTSKVATVSLAWTTTPSTDSQYVLVSDGIDAATVAQIADGVWDEARSGHVSAGSFGEYVLADATRVSGSTTAADGLEAAVSGATPLPADIHEVGGVAEDLPTATALATVDSNVDAILVDTGTTIPAQITALNDPAVSDILTPRS